MVADFPTPSAADAASAIRAHCQCGEAGCACRTGRRVHCPVPAHADADPSFSVSVSKSDRLLVRCYSGCDQQTVVAALGRLNLWPGRPRRQRASGQRGTVGPRREAKYAYVDSRGTLLAYHMRIDVFDRDGTRIERRMWWAHPDGRPSSADAPIRMDDLPVYRLPELVESAAAAARVLFVEGEQCCDAVRRLGFVAVSAAGGAEQRAFGSALQALRGRDVCLLADNDEPGDRLMRRVASLLGGVAASLRLVVLPDLPEKGDVADWIQQGGTAEELEALCAATEPLRIVTPDLVLEPEAEPEPDDRPTILIIDEDLPALARQAFAAIDARNQPPRLFRFGDEWARVETDVEGVERLRVLGPADVAYLLARSVTLKTVRQKMLVTVHPPGWFTADLLAEPAARFPALRRLSAVPIVAEDGRVVMQPGYDAETRVFYAPPAGLTIPPVPEQPTEADVQNARDLLDELLVDFYFASASDRTHAIALFLLPFLRSVIRGLTPLHGIEASVQGTGKGLLAHALLLPAVGPTLPAVPPLDDADQQRKELTAILLKGPPVILLDNIEQLRGGPLAAALTTETWSDRRLGYSQQLDLPNQAIWVCTGNNIIFSRELARRTVRIRLQAQEEHPEDRSDFLHPDLLGWVSENRDAFVWAGLTLVRYWFAAGCPEGTKPLGSYERWAKVLGGVLGACGYADFLENRADFYSMADADGADWHAFVAAWLAKFGDKEVQARDLLQTAVQYDGLGLNGVTIHAQASQLGQLLRKKRDTISGHHRLVMCGKQHQALLWRLLAVE